MSSTNKFEQDLARKLRLTCENFEKGHTIVNVDNIQRAADRIEQLQSRLAELEQERDALAAHVERLRMVMAHGILIENEDMGDIWGICPVRVDKALRESPQTSLAERDAQVIEDCLKAVGKMENHDKSILTSHNQILEYVNKLLGERQ